MESFRRSYYAGIFLIAAATLLLEIALTKVFSVIHYHYFAFLIVSTALFGYGFSGIFLSTSKWPQIVPPRKLMFVGSLLFAVTIAGAYGCILAIPLNLNGAFSNLTQALYLMAVYLLLALPFFFSGLVIGVL